MGFKSPEQPANDRLPLDHGSPVPFAAPVAAIYPRISTSGQEDGNSLDTQIELCRALAESKGYQVREEFIYREVWSGADIDRPMLTKLLVAVRARQVKAVFAYHLDRWSRDPLHALMLIDELQSHGVQLHFVNGSLEDTPEGRLILYVQGFAGQQERLRFIDRTRTGKAASARAGRLPNGTGAGLYGYDYDRVNKVRVVKEVEANIVRMVFQWASEGVSKNQIAIRLNNLGVPSKRRCKWHPLGIRRLLQNRAYTGVQFYGENRYRKVKGGKREVKANPPSEVIRIEGFIPRIISEELFELVQERMACRQATVNGFTRRYLLTGFTKCLLCGSPVVGACLGGKYRYYRCRATVPTSVRPASCNARYIPADALEEWVYGTVSEVVRDPSVLSAELEDHLFRQVGDTSDEIPSLRRQIRGLADEQGRLMDQRGNDLIDQAILESRIAPVKALYDEKRSLLRSLEEQQRLKNDAAVIRDRIAEYCRELTQKLTNLDFDGKRALLGAFGVRIEATRDDVSVTVVLDPKFTTTARTLA